MEINEVVGSLEMLQEDPSISRNINNKLTSMIKELKGDSDTSLKVNKCLGELDEIANDVNTPTFIRTQVWGVASMLEKLQ